MMPSAIQFRKNVLVTILVLFCNSIVAQMNPNIPALFDMCSPHGSAGTFFGKAIIDGNPAEEGDWIAAFDEDDNCAGASQLIVFNGEAYINLPIYGNDGTTPTEDEGMDPGENFYLKIYDASEDKYIIYPNDDFPYPYFDQWLNVNGAPIPAYADWNKEYDFSSTGIPYEVASTNTAGTFLGTATIDGVYLTEDDWIAAFDEGGNLAGATQLIVNNGVSYINLTIYGDDPYTTTVDEGINAGEKFYLQVYDASDHIYINYPNNDSTSLFEGWANMNGAPIPLYSNFNANYNFLQNSDYLVFLALENFCLSEACCAINTYLL